jgi:predicted TIM-barrel fold metal-dependent hydrolase
VKLVDTHQHLWDLQRFPCAWCQGIPALNRSFLLADYEAAAHGLGIAQTVFMECDVDEPHALAEARTIQALADRHASIAGIVASGRPEREGFREHLRELARLPKVKGVRRILHTQPDELSQAPLFAANVRRLEEFGFTFDICALARQLPIAASLVEACPQVYFILDHCGVPDVKGRAFDPWRDHIRRLAQLPNLACKLSGLVAYADPRTWTAETLQPWVAHVIEHFGWERIVWGGDWPVCTLSATLAQWVEATHALTAGVPPERRERLYHRNAELIYRL